MSIITSTDITNAPSIEAAGDLYIAARAERSSNWSAIVKAMGARYDAIPAEPIIPLVKFG